MDLFERPELTRKQKLIKSRKITTDFTAKVIAHLNGSGCFKVWRNNNTPSTRLYKEKEWLDGETESGEIVRVLVEIPKVAFKSNQIKVSTFDIIGFRLADGAHVEIEIKTKDKLDADQKTHLTDLQRAKCISFATSNFAMFLIQIEPYLIYKQAF